MYLIISASPNDDGLTAACVQAAEAGFREAGVAQQHVNLCHMALTHCAQCNNGWGQCRTEHTCVADDELNTLLQALQAADGVVIITPVYWGEMAESAKSTLDRVRRCETTAGDAGRLVKKPVIAVAAAGGSGGGLTSCLFSMERFIQHTRAQVADLIGVTQRNRAYKLETIRNAALTLAR
jgi:multimeric flavodoxin WrbA